MDGDAGLLHQQLQLEHRLLADGALTLAAQRGVVAADDLLAGGLADRLVVEDAVAGHVDAHVGWGFVRALAQDLLKGGAQHREDLDIAVVVDGGGAVGLQVERVDHVDVV